MPCDSEYFVFWLWNCSCLGIDAGVARSLALAGYAVYGMDYPGHGLSEGLHTYIPDFDKLVDDVIEQYTMIKGSLSYP